MQSRQKKHVVGKNFAKCCSKLESCQINILIYVEILALNMCKAEVLWLSTSIILSCSLSSHLSVRKTTICVPVNEDPLYLFQISPLIIVKIYLQTGETRNKFLDAQL